MLYQPPQNDTPFHKGEKEVQDRLGVVDIEQWAKKVVRNYLPADHRDFHTALPFLIAGARDTRGRPWATLLTGPSGFVSSPDPNSLLIDAEPVPGDALRGALKQGSDLGLLGIEFATRRRNRVNGRIGASEPGQLLFKVDQAFGNCPQYIRERGWRRVMDPPSHGPIEGKHLTQSQAEWIGSADTFFLASGYRGAGEHDAYGMDVSHRGGDSGFVEVLDETTLMFPDYAGNNHFNTVGNLMLEPRAGFLFLDFGNGSLLQITGTTTIDWDSERLAKIPGARRLITLHIDDIVELRGAVPLRWDADAESVRSLRLIKKIRESANVTSFVFEARDDGDLAPFQAGQHLPIELAIPGLRNPVRRTYSLSNGPNQDFYRISVKRERRGLASAYLHDHVGIGTIIDSRVPAGDFVLPTDHGPIVLVSAGIGLTPLLSMLHHWVAEDRKSDIWFIHGARDGDHNPLTQEVRRIADDYANVQMHIAYSNPRNSDHVGVDYDSKGRINGAQIMRVVGAINANYYLCGPTSFMAGLQNDLERLDVPADQIHVESFGPAGSS